jgi:hypothetical protein
MAYLFAYRNIGQEAIWGNQTREVKTSRFYNNQKVF